MIIRLNGFKKVSSFFLYLDTGTFVDDLSMDITEYANKKDVDPFDITLDVIVEMNEFGNLEVKRIKVFDLNKVDDIQSDGGTIVDVDYLSGFMTMNNWELLFEKNDEVIYI